MLHLPELAEVGTRGFARGTEDGAATLPARSIDSVRVIDGPTGHVTVGLKLELEAQRLPGRQRGQAGPGYTDDLGLTRTDAP
jgi:hypothetical protein